MFETTIAGSLPKPAWLAEPNTLWAPWRLEGAALQDAKGDATLLAIKSQEDAGIDIVGDGEQARQHFVHGFLERVEGIDFAHKVEMGIRADRYKAMVPQVVGPLRLKERVHAFEAQLARAHTKKKLKFTLPGPMTIADTIADRHYGDKVKMAMAFADLLNQEARALEKDGVDVIQFDEPAFNVFMGEVTEWGIEALERAAKGLTCTTAVHICYGYGIKANIDWKATLGGEWRQYEAIFPALARSKINQVSVECRNSKVPIEPLEPARRQGHPRRRHRRGKRRRRDARGRGGASWPRSSSTCRKSASSSAPTAAWPPCAATSPTPSWRRSPRARRWRARAMRDVRRADIEAPSRGRGETGRRNGLGGDLSAPGETPDAELPKLGETLTGNPEPSPGGREPSTGRCRD